MPPMKISDVPLSDPTNDRNFRSYKLQFQAPPNVAVYSWKIHLVSDTFLGEEVIQDIVVRIIFYQYPITIKRDYLTAQGR